MGKLENAKHKYNSANQYFKNAFLLAPKNPLLLELMGKNYFDQGDYKNAILVLTYHLNTLPNYWQFKNNLSRLSSEDRWKYSKLYENNTWFWKIFYYLAQSSLMVGNIDDASFYIQFMKDGPSKELLFREYLKLSLSYG